MDTTESVDFDFFDTPRNNIIENSTVHHELKKSEILQGNRNTNNNGKVSPSDKFEQLRSRRDNDSESDSCDTSSSYSNHETPKYERKSRPSSSRGSNKNTSLALRNTNSNRVRHDDGDGDASDTESSSAYSNTDYSSNEMIAAVHETANKKKEKLTVYIPKPKFEAWGSEYKHDKSPTSQEKQTLSTKKGCLGKKSHVSRRSSSDSEGDSNNYQAEKKHDRKQKQNVDKRTKDSQKSFKSNSSSFSNNSDITDVSPLDSPEGSPRSTQKRSGKNNGICGDVQYKVSVFQEGDANIKLETEQIDLSVLMQCMADIDNEKQERLNSNSRRVMFAPAAVRDKAKSNYSFSENTARSIEKENQRLLKQIMNKMHKGSNTKQTSLSSHGPRKATEPMIPRITPSAVNRMREQRRIESENMMILKRLQTIRPSPGITKTEQLTNFKHQMGFSIPPGTVVIPGSTSMYDTASRLRSAHIAHGFTSGSTRRSRPSSAKSSSSSISGKKSRPSSAKSNLSLRSNVSLGSNASKWSIRSNTSSVARMAGDRVDHRPAWDDRFAYS